MKPYTNEEMKPWDAVINAMTPEEMRLELHFIVQQLGPELMAKKNGVISNTVAYAIGMLDALIVVLR